MSQGMCPASSNPNLDCNCQGTGLGINGLQQPSFRPRGALARALHEKEMADDYLKTFDKNEVRKKVMLIILIS